MTNLQNLQQQIVSEAVKAFREKFGMKVIETVNAGNYTSHFTADNPAIEEWLTDQLAQAMRKHGRAIVERLEAAKKQHPMQNYEFQEGFSSAIAHADSWLNHNSEEGRDNLNDRRIGAKERNEDMGFDNHEKE